MASDTSSSDRNSNLHSSSPEIVVLDSDDKEVERDDTITILEPTISSVVTLPASVPEHKDEASSLSASFLNDRTQMEKERLARVEKRKRKEQQENEQGNGSASPSISTSTNKKVKLNATSGNSMNVKGNVHQFIPQDSSSSNSSTPQINSENDVRYWDGTIKLTYNSLCHSPGSLSLTQVIGPKSRLKNVICSSFDTDLDFVVDNFPKNVNIMLVMPSDGRNGIFTSPAYPNLRLCFPVMKNHGAMHIKFIMLFYDSFFRLVIPTANLRPHDWDLIENALFIHDFKLGDNVKSTFGSDLESLLKNLGVPNGCSDGPHKFDLSPADKSYRLVVSLSGTYTEMDKINRYGHVGLGRALENLNVNINEDEVLEAEYQGSSIGMYKTQSSTWITEFYRSITLKTPKQMDGLASIPPINILFPTEETVRRSILGQNGAMTLFCNERSWTANTPKNKFRDVQSKRTNVLMHTKMLLGLISSKHTQRDSNNNNKPKSGFLYVGSHNFTPSAWGRYSGQKKLTIANHELGVVMKLDENQVRSVDDLVPWVRPPLPYKPTDRPWIQSLYKG